LRLVPPEEEVPKLKRKPRKAHKRKVETPQIHKLYQEIELMRHDINHCTDHVRLHIDELMGMLSQQKRRIDTSLKQMTIKHDVT